MFSALNTVHLESIDPVFGVMGIVGLAIILIMAWADHDTNENQE